MSEPQEKLIKSELRTIEGGAQVTHFQSDTVRPKGYEYLEKSKITGLARSSLNNTMMVCKLDPVIANMFRNHVYTDELIQMHPFPSKNNDAAMPNMEGEFPRIWDEDFFEFWVNYISEFWGFVPKTVWIKAQLKNVLGKLAYNPVLEYLENLPEWDGDNRISTLLCDEFGVPRDEYYLSVMLPWMLCAIRRGLEAGSDASFLPVIIGGKGMGKTSFWQELIPPGMLGIKHFSKNTMSDTPRNLESLHSQWVTLLDEIDFGDGSWTGLAKDMISKNKDFYRKLYQQRNGAIKPRRFIFCGATNVEQFLVEPNKERRFLPVKANTPRPYGSILSIRDQLWAEAYFYYKDAKPYDFNPPDIGDKWKDLYDDGFVETIERAFRDWDIKCKSSDWFYLEDLLDEMQIPKEKRGDKKLKMQIRRDLESMGYERVRRRVGGDRVYVYQKMGPQI